MQVPFAVDSVSPQTPLVEEAVRWLRSRLAEHEGRVLSEALERETRAIADAQPAMAALVALGTRALAVARKAETEGVPPAEARTRVVEALDAWLSDFRAAGDAVVREARAILPATGWVATTTRSSLVERLLVAAHAEGRPVKALIAESRPMYEGRALATALASAGIPVWMTTDGALPLVLPQAGVFLAGADAVREKTFVAKAGTHALLLVARELNLPAYVLAQRAKFAPNRLARLTLPRRDAIEVWPDAPPGVTVVNLPFEEIPLSLVRGVITEAGFLGARETADAASVAPVDRALRDPAPPAEAV